MLVSTTAGQEKGQDPVDFSRQRSRPATHSGCDSMRRFRSVGGLGVTSLSLIVRRGMYQRSCSLDE